MKAAVAVFLKYPTPGKVKTRLAATLGDTAAARAYAAMVEHVLSAAVEPLPQEFFQAVLYCDPFQPQALYERAYPAFRSNLTLQRGAGLGERLSQAFEDLFATYSPVIAIGTDCIELTVHHLIMAWKHLKEGADVVLGPAQDGGYYLVGLRAFYPQLFERIAWGTDQVFQQTSQRASALNLAVRLLPQLADIDTEEDLRRSALRVEDFAPS